MKDRVAGCGRFISNLPQKNTVLHISVAGVAGVAGYFYTSHTHAHAHGSKSKKPYIPATPATASASTAFSLLQVACEPATNLQQGGQ
ncbi:hypothetical protein [Deinococcus alpinitundrae]|uniref:hypothetical protein n=1 Tax=Deinococcus alpinitundrae TaxID=468913 RepID=UPI00137A4860|nr:hypothetical protein [Deinococcus alpinitundrae]